MNPNKDLKIEIPFVLGRSFNEDDSNINLIPFIISIISFIAILLMFFGVR